LFYNSKKHLNNLNNQNETKFRVKIPHPKNKTKPIWNLGFEIWILDFGFWNLDFGIWILEFGFWNLDFEF
jgi:hypothetical protein